MLFSVKVSNISIKIAIFINVTRKTSNLRQQLLRLADMKNEVLPDYFFLQYATVSLLLSQVAHTFTCFRWRLISKKSADTTISQYE